MARGSRPEKVQEWTHRLQRFEDSSLTVAEFCKAEHVSEQSYYHWKKKLRDASARLSPQSHFQAVRVSSARTAPNQPTLIQLGRGIQIELGNDLPVADLVVNRVLDVVVDADRTRTTLPTKAK